MTPTFSGDGRLVGFWSCATNLVAGDTNAVYDCFVRDRQRGTTERVSVATDGSQGSDDSFGTWISADGRFAAFYGPSTNLVIGDSNGQWDVFLRDRGASSAFTSFCFGDGAMASCPCNNSGVTGGGCQNSAGTGGALLAASGTASLSSDTVRFTSSGELPAALTIVLQGSLAVAPMRFGDGLSCEAGALKRLYVSSALGGVVVVPGAGDPSVSSRSAALGDSIPLGAPRNYQAYYRDPSPTFCPNPPGGTLNASNAIAVAWGA